MRQREMVVANNSNGSQEQTRPLNVGIVGCGRMGKRRAKVVFESQEEHLCVVADTNDDRSRELASELACQHTNSWEAVVENPDVDVVVVSVPNKFLLPVVTAALRAGKHVLCEKPPGRNVKEAQEMIEAARQAPGIFRIGFNKRFHPAIKKLRELFDEDVLGPVLYSRAIFGHGASPGLEKTWFASADLAGGGALIDIGVHMVDLLRWFMGDFNEVYAVAPTYYWDLDHFPTGEQLDDNAFFLLRTSKGQVAQVHASWTQWKNRFSFEIFGRDGYLEMNGLGGYYGESKVTWGRRRPESGPPEIKEFTFDGPDDSLRLEWEDFMQAVQLRDHTLANAEDSVPTMRIVSCLYESAHSGQAVRF